MVWKFPFQLFKKAPVPNVDFVLAHFGNKEVFGQIWIKIKEWFIWLDSSGCGMQAFEQHCELSKIGNA